MRRARYELLSTDKLHDEMLIDHEDFWCIGRAYFQARVLASDKRTVMLYDKLLHKSMFFKRYGVIISPVLRKWEE